MAPRDSDAIVPPGLGAGPEVERLRSMLEATQARAAELARANAALTRSTARLAERADLDAFLGGVLIEAAGQAGAVSNGLFLYDAEKDALAIRAYAREGVLLDIATEHRHGPAHGDLARAGAGRPHRGVAGHRRPCPRRHPGRG